VGRLNLWRAAATKNFYAVKLRPARGCNARNALQVAYEFDVLKPCSGEKALDILLLAKSEFEDKIAAREKSGLCRRDETPVDLEAVLPSEERDVRFMLTNFDGNECTVAVRNIGRVRDDNLESLARHRREEVAFEKANSVHNIIAGCILARHGESWLGNVDRGQGRSWKLGRKGNDDGSGAGAYV